MSAIQLLEREFCIRQIVYFQCETDWQEIAENFHQGTKLDAKASVCIYLSGLEGK